MLTHIIKRNGQQEVFTSSKANNWAIWAGKGLEGRLDWSSIVQQVVGQSPSTLTSQEFQNKLITACLNFNDWPHNLMAGRLYSVLIRKKLYGDKMPTVKELHNKLSSKGFMLSPQYSDEEYAEIENIIDHQIDFTFSHFQLKTFYGRYALANRVTGEVYETPQFTYMRMAMALQENTDPKIRLDRIRSQYMDLAKNKVNPPSPNFTNLGTKQRGYASCCLYAAGDTADSIGISNTIAYTMTCASAGIGGIKMIRSAKDPVRNGVIEHQGKLPYFEAAGKIVGSSLQGGRGGALTEYVSVYDPEITTIVMCQNPRTATKVQIRSCHFAVLLNGFFGYKVAKREKIFTFNVFTAPDLTAKFFSDDRKGFEELYNKYEQNPNFVKNYIDAYELAVMIESQGHEVSTLYTVNIEEMNRHTPFKEPIHSSNLCVAGNTKILTDQGYLPISSLEDLEVKVWNGQEFSTTTVRKTGHSETMMFVKNSRGKELICTPYHKFYIYDKEGVKEVRAKDLSPGMELIQYDLPTIPGVVDILKPYENGVVNTRYKMESHFPTVSVKMGSFITWFNGVADTIGELLAGGDEGLALYSNSRTYLNALSLLLQTRGIDSSVQELSGTEEVVCALEIDLLNLHKLLERGFRFKNATFKNLTPKPDESFQEIITVTSVAILGSPMDTYCFTEPIRNMGMFNGMLTGNCVEIAEPTKPYYNRIDLETVDHHNGEIATCNLAGIVVSKIKTDAEYEEACYNALDMIDKTIDIADYPFKHVGYTARNRRNAAVGMLGVAEYFAKRGIYYSSQYGLEVLHQLSERHYYFLLKAALRLGKERGNAAWIDKTKWPEGWLPIDTYKKKVDEIVPHKLNYDWETLRQEIIANKGIRFSCLCAHMPTETSSKAAGVPNSIFPVRDLYLKKTDMSLSMDWCAPDGDLYDDTYERAYDIDIDWQIKMYAVVQKFTDQAISAEYWMNRVKNPTLEANDLVGHFLDRIRYGIKSKYYQHSLTSETVSLEIDTKPETCSGGGCTL